jgi:hypothetical protein
MAHNIEQLREEFKSLMDTLMYKYNLKDYLDCTPEEIDMNWKEGAQAEDDLGIWSACGCTKFVIGTPNDKYIIKFQPFSIDDDTYNEDGFNYCAREVDVYKEAERAGFGDKFAWSEFLFDYEVDGWTIPMFVMEKCHCSSCDISDDMDDWHYSKFCESAGVEKSDEAFHEYNSNYKYNKSYDSRMMEWACSVWGFVDTEAARIVEFMRDMCINDIHCGNWGWCDNRLVLTDYSGYGSCMEIRSINY